MHPRLLSTLIAAVAIAGCATPPDLPQPKPLDYREQAKAEEIYRKYNANVRDMDGVYSTYLTANNNPRQFVVVVRDAKAGDAVWSQFHGNFDGLPMKIQVVPKIRPDDDPIVQVKTVELPTTWWGQVMAFFQSLPERWMRENPPSPAPSK